MDFRSILLPLQLDRLCIHSQVDLSLVKLNKNPENFKQAAQALKKKRDERLEARDHLHLDPSERANFIMTLLYKDLGLDEASDALDQPLFSDLLSFAIEFLGVWAMSMDDEGLTSLVKKLSRVHYSLHYSYPDNHPALGPHREEHERIWKERIERKLST